MNNLLKHVESKILNHRSMPPTRMPAVLRVEECFGRPMDISESYEVRVVIGARVSASTPNGLVNAKLKVMEYINHEVFGEFRSDLLQAMVALENYDVDTAKERINRVMTNMFDI